MDYRENFVLYITRNYVLHYQGMAIGRKTTAQRTHRVEGENVIFNLI